MTPNPIEFALRVCESIAFGLHAVLGIIEPWTGCLRTAFRDNGAMPRWFWPVAGVLLGVVAMANFSESNEVVEVTNDLDNLYGEDRIDSFTIHKLEGKEGEGRL